MYWKYCLKGSLWNWYWSSYVDSGALRGERHIILFTVTILVMECTPYSVRFDRPYQNYHDNYFKHVCRIWWYATNMFEIMRSPASKHGINSCRQYQYVLVSDLSIPSTRFDPCIPEWRSVTKCVMHAIWINRVGQTPA